jgi:hypothetical protein
VKMNRKTFSLALLILSAIAFSNVASLVQAQTATTLDFRFRGLAAGQCIIAYGGPGPGFPNPLNWAGLGDGCATADGFAADATATFPSPITGLYISENIRASGTVSVKWTEGDESRHHLTVRVYSTEASEGLFFPSNNQFVLSIRMYSPPEKCFRFKGVYVSGSGTASISGITLFASGIYGPFPWPDVMIVLLFDEQSGTLFFIAWSRSGTPTPVPPGYLPAAKAYSSFSKEA